MLLAEPKGASCAGRWGEVPREHAGLCRPDAVAVRSGPEQMAKRITLGFSDDASVRISHAAISQSRYIEGRGALRAQLALRPRAPERAFRAPRDRSRDCHIA